MFMACSSGSDGDPAIVDSDLEEFPMDALGGTIEYILPDNPDIEVSLTVPEDAVPDGTVITVEPAESYPENKNVIPSLVFDFGPDGLVFNTPSELVITYDPDNLGGIPETFLAVYKMTNGTWEQLQSTVDTVNKTVTAMITGFSEAGAGRDSVPPETTATPGWGYYPDPIDVTLTCDDNGGSGCDTTYYTIDGSAPSPETGTAYSGPIHIAVTTNLRFASIDLAGNLEQNPINNYRYDMRSDFQGPTTTADPSSQNCDAALNVSLICDDGSEGSGCASTYYTTDGNRPNVASQVYETAIPISSTTTLMFFSKDNDGNIGRVQAEYYLFGGDQDTDSPVTSASPGGGDYDEVQQVVLSCDDQGGVGCEATYYTLNGDTPTTSSSVYSGQIQIQADTTLKFFSVDKVGNAEDQQTEPYVIDLAPKYYVGGNINGLDGTIVLQNNGTGDLSVSGSGSRSFLFSTPLLNNEVYGVTVLTPPEGQTCSVPNGSGTIAGANVQDIVVNCVTSTYTVGGVVNGLIGTLTLQNNDTDDRPISDNGEFTFATTLVDNASYDVSVSTQPVGQSCSPTNGSGTIAGSNVDNVSVSCQTDSAYHTIGGTVSGLTGNLVLQNNGAHDQVIRGNGSYIFKVLFAESESYAVSVLSAPATQNCVVANESGTITDSDVEDVNVTCSDLGDTVSGQAVLGPIRGGDVAIYDLSDLSTPVFEGLTSDTNGLTTAGLISILPESFQDTALYLVVVTGGEDIDPDDDGVVNIPATPVAGKFHALITGSQLKAGGWYVSVLTEKAFRTARYLLLAAYSSDEIIASLDTSAEALLLADRNADGHIDHLDLNLWHPVDHAGDTRLPAATRNMLVKEVHEGTFTQDHTGWIGSYDIGEVEAVEVIGNRAYVLSYPRTFTILDISGASNPDSSDIIGQKTISFSHNLNDLKVIGNTAFVVGQGDYGFHVLDITDPQHITSTSYNSLPGNPEVEGIDNCDAIRIKGDVAYIMNWGGWTGASGNASGVYLIAIDVSDPGSPSVLGTFFPEYGNNQGYDILTKGSSLYFLAATNDMNHDHPIVDITNPAAMTQTSTLQVFGPYHNAIDGNYLYSVTADGLKIFDITTPGSPVLQATFQHPAYDMFNELLMGVSFRGTIDAAGDRVYIAGDERIYVIDAAIPASPSIIGHVPFPGGGTGDAIHVTGGLAYVGANNGLHVVDVTDPAPRGIVGSVEVTAAKVEVQGDTAFSVTQNRYSGPRPGLKGMDIVDLSDPTAPQWVGGVLPQPPPGWPSGHEYEKYFYRLAVAGNHVFVGPVLHVVDVTDTSDPQVIAVDYAYDEVNHFDVVVGAFSNLYFKGPNGLEVVDYTDPADLQVMDSTGIPSGGSLAVGSADADSEKVYFENQRCNVQNQHDILISHEVDDQGNLTPEGELPTYDFPEDECVNDIAVNGGVVVVPVSGDWGDYIYSLDVSAYPDPITYIDKIDALSNEWKRVEIRDNRAYVASVNSGLHIVDINPDGTLTPIALVKTPVMAFDISFFGDYGVIADGNALVVIRLPVQEVP